MDHSCCMRTTVELDVASRSSKKHPKSLDRDAIYRVILVIRDISRENHHPSGEEMTLEKWLIHPGETRVIDIETVRSLKVGLVGGQIDVIAHDEPGARIEVHGVTVKELRIEVVGEQVEIDHPQLRWD